MMTAKQAVEKAVSSNSDKSDLELYAAHVELEQKWTEIKEMLVYSGHWPQYQKFVEDRREREKQQKIAETRARLKKQKMHKDIAVIAGGVAATIAVIVLFLWAIAEAKG
jgi:hypothetical protein